MSISDSWELVPTACQETWPAAGSKLFLGGWCLHQLEALPPDSEVLPLQMADSETAGAALRQLSELREKTLTVLTPILNSRLKVEQDSEYWAILLGEWLYIFLQHVYAHYRTVQAALKSRPGAQAPRLPFDQWVVSSDHEDYFWNGQHDPYSAQLFTQIFEHLEVPGPKRPLLSPLEQSEWVKFERPPALSFRGLVDRVDGVLRGLGKLLHRKRLLLTVTAYARESRQFALCQGLRYACDDFHLQPLPLTGGVDWAWRKETRIPLGEDPFEKLVGELLPLNIPLVYLEVFPQLREAVMKPRKYVHYTAALTSHAVHTSPSFCLFAAERKDEMQRMVHQHGGNYGVSETFGPEISERRFANHYFTWGWSDGPETSPLASPVLERFRRLSSRPIPDGGPVLFTMTAMPRYLYRIQQQISSSSYISVYLDEMIRFLRGVKTLGTQVIIRVYPHGHQYGWNGVARVETAVGPLSLDEPGRSFHDSVAVSRLCVYGHLATTYLQSLVAGRPTIVYLTPALDAVRPSVRPQFDALASVGILHDSPESAAAKVLEVEADPQSWWRQGEVQEAVGTFLSDQARTHGGWTEDWTRVLEPFRLRTGHRRT